MTEQSENKSKKREEKQSKLPWFGIPKLLPYLRPYRRVILIMIFLGLCGSAGDVLLPMFQRYAIDHFIAFETLDTLGFFIAAYVLTMVAQTSANFGSTYLACKVEQFINRDLRNKSFSHLQTLSFSYFNRNSVGYVHARVMSDTARIGELASWTLMDGVWHISYMVGAMGVMFFLRPKLALLVLTVVPAAVTIIALAQKKLLGLNRKIRETNSRITGDFNEGITGAMTVKTLTVEEKMENIFRRDTSYMRKVSVKASHFRALFSSCITFASSFALGLVLWQGGILSLEGLMELGILSIFMSYAQGIMEPIRWVIESLSNLITAQVNIERYTGLMETESNVIDKPEVIARYGDTFTPKRENWEPLSGDIVFDDVTFRYPDGEETVLEHFNLHIPQGSNLAIVGETGAGKSTLVNLICRFFEPTSGRILIDGKDARERSQLWLHENIGYVLQTPHLFSGTVRENLQYGNPEATDEEITEALRLVHAEDVISRMDKGLDSEVGEDGGLLSTGEKQLLSFARAILANPRILILDEATASIDTVTEQAIQSAIGKMIEGRTTVMIAHRLSTVRDANEILVVKDGKIIERGRHETLMKAKGHYYALYSQQFEEDAVGSVLRG